MEKNNEYRYIGQRLIRNEPGLQHIRDYGIKIAYIACYEAKEQNHKTVMADCTLVSKKYKWCCPYDFFITVYTPNVAELTEKQMEILILHELYHVGVDDTKMEPKFYVVPHDVEEFNDIIKRYGLYWDRGD